MTGEPTTGAIEAIRADRAALLEICGSLSAADWGAPSGCEGWSVKDVVAHLGALFWLVVDPGRLPAADGLPTEQAQDAYVRARRALDHAAVLEDYVQVSSAALDQLARLAGFNVQVPLGDLGSYPASLLPAAYSFDHYTHIRADLFAPRGPLTGPPPPSDELRLGPTLDWIEAALPQQNPAAAEECSLELQVTGTGARIISFGSGEAMATISSDAASFVRWVTQRGSWEELGVQAVGDQAALAAARKLKVF
jgi:uncharacterized protein (TIGR03083 family)